MRKLLGARNETEYNKIRLQTGIVKPSIFSGLPSARIFPLPGCFPADIMHLVALNLPELLFKLWRGKIEHHKEDDPEDWPWAVFFGDDYKKIWEAHGQGVG